MAGGGFGTAAADEFDAPVLTDFAAAANQDHADLAGVTDVSAAAGLQVNAGDFDGAQDAGALHLLARAHLGELLGGAVADGDFAVFKDDGVGGAGSAFKDESRGLLATKVNAADGFAEMERDGGQAKTFLKHGGEQVLAGVLLHVVETAGPVDAAFDTAGGDGTIDDMEDVFVLEIADVEYVGFAEFAQVAGLTAGGGVEVGLVEEHTPAGGVVAGEGIGQRLALEDVRGEVVLEGIVEIEAARGHKG